MKTKILEHVRNVCGLKKLEKGSIVKQVTYKLKISGEPEVLKEKYLTVFDKNYSFDGERFHHDGYVFTGADKEYTECEERFFYPLSLKDDGDTRFEIIGLPVQLQSVIKVLPKDKWSDICELWVGNGDLSTQPDSVFDFIHTHSV